MARFHSHLKHWQDAPQPLVLIAPGGEIGSLDFRPMITSHGRADADITVLYRMEEEADGEGEPFRVQEEEERLTGVMLMKRSLFIELVQEAYGNGREETLREAVLHRLAKLNVCAYPMKGLRPSIDSEAAYHRESLSLLDRLAWNRLFGGPVPIRTKAGDCPPAHYRGRPAVRYSLVGGGCIIEGQVESSILHSGVKVGEGAVIRNSIILDQCVIQPHSYLENVILEQRTHVERGRRIAGTPGSPFFACS
ncbi:hypothetical protein N6H14_04095 [Paenibacillus sp. CC-CFT747]|nr:hypothetical protein N6H14_04095 [Paenibacillus sp. CC-CFT747]